MLKRTLKRLIHHYVALSVEGRDYLQQRIGVPTDNISLICNGVDTNRFQPAARQQSALPDTLAASDRIIFGSVGRIADVKNQQLLVNAYIALCQQDQAFRQDTALVVVGDGPARPALQQQLQQAGLSQQCWLPGDRNDIAAILPGLSVYVLPSLAEGISNTILEAMACGLPVIASNVGGNPELVSQDSTGWLFTSNDSRQLQQIMTDCLHNRSQLAQFAANAREAAVAKFSLDNMVSQYQQLYLGHHRQQQG